MLIFKICHMAEWQAAQPSKVFHGTAKDGEDGFLHFSTGMQIPATLNRHYADADNLVLVAVEADRLGRRLKWEPSSNGDLYPHLYSVLSLSDVAWALSITRKPNGAFALPAQVFATDGTPPVAS